MKKEVKTHKQTQLEIAAKLPIEEGFTIPDGLMIPAGYGVLVKRVRQAAFISQGGIIMPAEDSKKIGNHGIVMAIGPLVDLEAYPVKLGVKIEFHDGLQEDTLHSGQKYLLIDQHNIKGLIPDGNFKHPKYPTVEEIRRGDRIDATARIHQEGQKKLDEINNG